jgi:2-iminobutanoate/2-iminopropanoate deaminase
MSAKQIADPGLAWNQSFGFSQAVRAGGLIFLAGQTPVDENAQLVGEGDIRAQTRQVFENMKTVLANAGSSLDNLVEVVSYNTDMADLMAVAEVKAGYLTKDFPAWTAIGVTALAFPGQLIEIKAVAVAR